MVRVKVKLYATLRKYRPELGHGEAAPFELRDGATLRDLLAAIGIPAAETKQCFVNAVGQDLDFVLHDGDEVGVFPPIAGGAEEYTVVIEQDEEGYFVASVPALPGCHTQARSLDELEDRVEEAVLLCLEVQGR